jgi:hypothetical protein
MFVPNRLPSISDYWVSRIVADSWAAYLHLNELGYEYFLVTHKSFFKQSYRNVQTGQTELKEHTKISKDHIR